MSEEHDVFICFKNLDERGRRTEDAALAQDVHDFLAARDFRVFFSNVSLEKLGVSAYKKAIDRALDSARVLVAVGTSAANLNAEWVRYEWDSFFSDVLSGAKPEGRVFVYTRGVDLKDLPRTLRQSQAIKHAPGSLELLFNFIANAFDKEPIRMPVVRGAGEYAEPPPAIETILRDIDELVHALENFHSNPEGIYYIGQTLVRCGSFFEDHAELQDAPHELVDALMDEVDSDERKEMGALDPVISVGKVRSLVRYLKTARKRFLQNH